MYICIQFDRNPNGRKNIKTNEHKHLYIYTYVNVRLSVYIFICFDGRQPRAYYAMLLDTNICIIIIITHYHIHFTR